MVVSQPYSVGELNASGHRAARHVAFIPLAVPPVPADANVRAPRGEQILAMFGRRR